MIRILTLVMALLVPHVARAQPPETSGTLAVSRVIRIGYLRGAQEGTPPAAELERLAAHLGGRSAVGESIRNAGYSGAALLPCDGGEDLLRRLDAGEFEVAFAPGKVFARQTGGYRAILQSRRAGDKFSPRGGQVLRTGAIVVSRRSPLFAVPSPSPEAIRDALAGRYFAVVSTQSVAGFVAPLNVLARDCGLLPQQMRLVWFESSEEAARAIISGLADAGACEAGALERVLAEAGKAPDGGTLARAVRFTEPLPTDPVIVRAELSPDVSPLGRQLRTAIREHFARPDAPIQYQEADSEAWRQVPALLAEFESRAGVLRP